MAIRLSTGYRSRILGPTAFDTIFQNGVIEVRSGVQPASANLAPTGVLLGRITRDGGAFIPGSPANGLQFERIGATVQKVATHVWSLEGIAAGTAAWARLLGNAADAGDESLVMPRIDFAIGDLDTAGDYQMRLPILAITNGLSIPIEQWTYSLPPIGA